MLRFLKSCKRKMSNSEEPLLSDSNINTGFVSFPPRFDDPERTLTCPTCGGSGKLTQEHENDLVALIPVRDNRLKPRIKTYILIAVLIIFLVVGALVAVFIFPRDVQIKITDSSGFNVTLAQGNESTAYMILNNTLNIENSNYFGVTVKGISQQVTWGGSLIVADQTFNNEFYIPAKSGITRGTFVKLAWVGKIQSKKMKQACCWFKMLFIVVTQGHANGLTVSQDVSNKVYKYVECLEDLPLKEWSKECG